MEKRTITKSKTLVIALTAFGVLIAVGFIAMVIRNLPGVNIESGIFKEIGEMDALNEYVVSDDKPEADKNLKGLTVEAEWVRVVEVDGAKCTVRAYVFGSREDAEAYYKKASGTTARREGYNYFGSAGGFFPGFAKDTRLNENRVLFITGRSLADIKKVMNAFFEANPGSILVYDKDEGVYH